MANKKGTSSTTVTRNIIDFSEHTGNVYESVLIMGKRANQISVNVKNELQEKLKEFGIKNDTLDEGDEIIEGYIPPAIDESDEPEVYMIVEQMPEFPGGEAELLGFISRNIHYPEEAKKKGIQGRVFIGFIIEKDGSVSNVRNLRGVNSELDAEAMRVVKSMPKWKPGMQNGEAVRVSYLIPINFKLEDQQD